MTRTNQRTIAPLLFIVPMLLLSPVKVISQDFDLYLNGRIVDAATGAPIPFARVRVIDRLDTAFEATATASVHGEFTRELYTGAVWEGGRYEVSFDAAGYEPRTALVDASTVDRDQDIKTAWRIGMEVPLLKAGGEDDRIPARIGTCAYNSSRGNFQWEERELRKAFPIKRYKDARIIAHAAIMDSVGVLDGVMLHGRVLSHWNETALQDALVWIEPADGSTAAHPVTTDEYGFFIWSLPFDKSWRLTFSKDGMVSKSFLIDLTGIPGEMREEGFSTLLDVRLFQPLPDEDLAFLDQPLSRMNYSAQDRNLVWDIEGSRPVLERLDGILSRHMATSLRSR